MVSFALLLLLAYGLWCLGLACLNLPIPYGDYQFFHEPIINLAEFGRAVSPGLACIHPAFTSQFDAYPPGAMLALWPFYRLISEPLAAFQMASYLTGALRLAALVLLISVLFDKLENRAHPRLWLSVIGVASIFWLTQLVPVVIHPQTLAEPIAWCALAIVLRNRPRKLADCGWAGILLAVACVIAPVPAVAFGMIGVGILTLERRWQAAAVLASTASMVTVLLFGVWVLVIPEAAHGFVAHAMNHVGFLPKTGSDVAIERYAARSSLVASLSAQWQVGLYLATGALATLATTRTGRLLQIFTVSLAVGGLLVAASGALDRLSMFTALWLALAAASVGVGTGWHRVVAMLVLSLIGAWWQVKASMAVLISDAGARYQGVERQLMVSELASPIRADTVYWLMLRKAGSESENLGYCPVRANNESIATV
ncbi:MAG: hypothetical protein KJ587_13310, partial [Alphaproteobacteria bacterium]|nr:hypothetical protein [Alphaproteobacteria bacterium]